MNFLSTPKNQRFSAFIFSAGILLWLVGIGLIIPVLSGLFAYKIVLLLSAKFLRNGVKHYADNDKLRARTWSSIVIAVIVMLTLGAAGSALHIYFKDGASAHELLLRISDIVESSKAALPAVFADMVPQKDALFQIAVEWLKIHAAELGSFGLNTIKGAGFALLGILLGSMVAIADSNRTRNIGFVSTHLLNQLTELREYFWFVASAQVQISAINTICTAAYLYIILPLFGIELSMRPALIATTFIAGLLPVIGNLVANTAMTVISLDYSLSVAISSLSFLIVIHKFEYFCVGRIIGHKIHARVWEILLSMIFLEHLLGIPGLVIAPILYAWFKAEWHLWDSHSATPTTVTPITPDSNGKEVTEII